MKIKVVSCFNSTTSQLCMNIFMHHPPLETTLVPRVYQLAGSVIVCINYAWLILKIWVVELEW